MSELSRAYCPGFYSKIKLICSLNDPDPWDTILGLVHSIEHILYDSNIFCTKRTLNILLCLQLFITVNANSNRTFISKRLIVVDEYLVSIFNDTT